MKEEIPNQTVEIAIFARTPALGRVKKRLAAQIGPHNALHAYEQLLAHTISAVMHAHIQKPSLCPVIWYKGPSPEPFLPPDNPFILREQQGSTFIENIQAVMDQVDTPNVDGVVIIGADHPTLLPHHIIRLVELLKESEVSIGPAEDGGFWGMGSKIPLPDLLNHIMDDPKNVLTKLLDRLNQRGINAALGPTLWDVDTEKDLHRWEALKKK